MAHYCLEASIDLSGITWSKAVIPWFGGSFNGNGYVISNLKIEGGGYLGLFGQLGSGANISNLGLEVVDVNGIGSNVGSLVGSNHFFWWNIEDIRTTIMNCYSRGIVSGRSAIGGLMGYNYGGSIITSYSTVVVSGIESVGGLVGSNGGEVMECYSAGSVSGKDFIGGLIGQSVHGWYVDGSATASFWDVDTSGLPTSDGGIGKTTAKMQTANTYLEAGWDFVDETANGTEDIWWIDEGNDYPRLWWELIPEN
jgi:hypothetical protein